MYEGVPTRAAHLCIQDESIGGATDCGLFTGQQDVKETLLGTRHYLQGGVWGGGGGERLQNGRGWDYKMGAGQGASEVLVKGFIKRKGGGAGEKVLAMVKGGRGGHIVSGRFNLGA